MCLHMPAVPSSPSRWPSWLPRGGSLPEPAWRARHRAIVALLWVHVIGIPAYAVLRSSSPGEPWLEILPVLLAAVVAGHARLGRRLSASIAAAGLVFSSGLIVHYSDGVVEAHFHFFVMIPVIAMYESWAPFMFAVLYAFLHHGVLGFVQPDHFGDHPVAHVEPWLFAGVHASFFTLACVASVINWWVHERARLAQQEQTRLLSTIVDSLSDGLVVIDSHGKVVLRNPAGIELMGGLSEGDPDESVGPSDQYGLFHLDGTRMLQHQLPHLRALVEGEPVHDMELVVRNEGVPEGRVLNFSATALPTQDVVVVFSDVTEEHRAKKALEDALATEQAAVERLRELERAKSEFVSTVSHELRTPITSIIGYLELLSDGAAGPLAAAQHGLLDRVDRNSQRLLRLVEDLLKLAQIEASSLAIDAVPTDLRDIVRSTRDMVAWLLDSRSVQMCVDVPSEAVELEVDPAELERMLVNLVSNAIKFTPDGGRIDVRLDADDLGATLVVSDTGVGVPESELDRLFTRFYRSSTATQNAVQGTGLGLTIVQAVVAAHGGTIQVESAVDCGTTVTVRLPRGGAERAGTFEPGESAPNAVTR